MSRTKKPRSPVARRRSTRGSAAVDHELYEVAVGHSLNGVAIAGVDGRLVFVNPAFLRIWGYRDADQVLGRNAQEFWAEPAEAERVIAVLHQHDHWTGELTARHADGGAFQVELQAVLVRGPDGKPRNMLASFNDISVRRRAAEQLELLHQLLDAEEALRSSEEMFRQLAEHIQETLFVRDLASNRMVYVSPSYETIWGRPRAALYADPADFLRSVHPDDLPRVIEGRDRQYAGHGFFNMEYRVLRPDGGVRWVWARTFPIPDEHGKVYRVAGLVQDLTERKVAEEALAASERQFRQLAENIQEVFWLVSPDRRTLYYVSPAIERMWGRSGAELYASPRIFLDTIHPDDRAQVVAQIESQRSGEFLHSYDHEFRIVRPDGEVRWIHSRYSPIRDDQGRVFRIAGISEDITERKQAEAERLAYAERQRDALVREVHHRIKNNLQGVIGLLRRQAQDHPGLGESMEGAVAQVGAMAVVHGLQGQTQDKSLLLCELARAVCLSVAGLTGAAVEPVVRRAAVRPVPVARDEGVAVALILNELVMNAVKHGRPEGVEPVEVTIDRVGNEAVLRVTNRGDSLPAGLDFQRGSGLGTGLSLVRSLLPREAASLTIAVENARIVAELHLSPPLVMFPADF